MSRDNPYYDDDESNHQEFEGTNDSEGFEFDDDETQSDSSAREEQSDNPSIIDLVANQEAAAVKQQIFQTLYSKVGERLDALKSETRAGAMNNES